MSASVPRPLQRKQPAAWSYVVGLSSLSSSSRSSSGPNCPTRCRLADRPVGLLQASVRVGERAPGWVREGDVVKAGHAVGLRWAAAGLPGVEADVVVIAPGRDEEKIAGAAHPDTSRASATTSKPRMSK
jgi:hypothetical protein